MGHDQLFKEFLQAFFRDFLELFCPDIAARLDFGTVRFLEKELFTDFPEGSLREADVVAEVDTQDGIEGLVLVHIEVQARREPNFSERMFQYYALLWLRYRKPIVPIVVYLKGGGDGLVEEAYDVTVLGRKALQFWYQSVSLAPLDAREYLGRGNPVAAALAALMDRRRSREPLTLRALMLQAVAESNLDDARKFMLLNLVETYFELAAGEEKRFRRLLSKKGFREVQEMQVTWADRMRAQYEKEGREQGLVEGKREALLRLLANKFGQLSEELTAQVRALESAEELDVYLDRVLTASTLGEMQLGARE